MGCVKSAMYVIETSLALFDYCFSLILVFYMQGHNIVLFSKIALQVRVTAAHSLRAPQTPIPG